MNDSDNTLKACRCFVERHPQATEAPAFLKRIGETYIALKALDSAADAFKELAESYPKASEALLWLAGRALSSQNYAEARICFQALADRYPQSDAGQRAPEYLERLSKLPSSEPRHES